MAPKKSRAKGAIAKPTDEDHSSPKTAALEDGDATKQPGKQRDGNKDKKRKAGSQASGAPAKSARRSERSAQPASLSEEEQCKILNYLLSPAALDHSRPKDEKKDVETRGGDKDVRTYSVSKFTPLEELISAMILSRPIGRK